MSIIEKALNKARDESKSLNSVVNLPNIPEDLSAKLEDALLRQPQAPNYSMLGENKMPSKKAVIDWQKLADLGFVTPDNINGQTIDEYRTIKRPLIDNALGVNKEGISRANLILITSSVPGEGKTFTAINLALSIVNELDKKVLLIDADVARPSIARVLGIDTAIGLIDYLDGDEIEFSDIELATSLSGLNLVTAGKQHRHSTELLSSKKMAALLEELSVNSPDRLVIFDSPPLLAATQGVVLAKLVGQVVLVIEAEKTSQSLVLESIDKLASCEVVLSVLNKVHRTSLEGYYGYGYGYGYSYDHNHQNYKPL